jgi:hypothetical protein
MTEMTATNIAEYIFNSNPSELNKIGLLFGDEHYDVVDLFETLLIIYMEGIDIIYNVEHIDDNKIEKDNLMFLNKWFEKLQIKIHIIETTKQKFVKLSQPYYCRILLNKGENKKIFLKHKIDKSYHFFLNDKFEKKSNLEHYFAIFVTELKIFIICFQPVQN